MGLGAWNTVRVWGAPAEKAGPGATLRHREEGGEHGTGLRGTDVCGRCRRREGQGLPPPGLPPHPHPNSKAGTYLMAFFSLRPRPESGVPTVSKEFL